MLGISLPSSKVVFQTMPKAPFYLPFICSPPTLPKIVFITIELLNLSLILLENPLNMAKIRIEICMISARGLPRSSSLWKYQWFAVGWVDPNNKYCSKIDSSGSSNPTWKTKFLVPINQENSYLQGMSLTVQVYRREPIFLREKLQGTATISLKEFFAKIHLDSESSGSVVEETGSFQLRKRNSEKPKGLIDISVRISDDRQGMDEGLQSLDQKNEITLAIEDGPVLAYPTQPRCPELSLPYGGNHKLSYPYGQPLPPASYSYSSTNGQGYHRPPPPPPPPPSHAGFMPPLFPGTSRPPENYVSLPPSGPGGQASRTGFGMGLGAGALAAGAVLFGDDFMSYTNFPTGLDSGSLILSTDPPF